MTKMFLVLTLATSTVALGNELHKLPEKGTVWKSHRSGMVGSDESFTVHSAFSFKQEESGLSFKQYTNFYNGHTCWIDGLAHKLSSNSYEMEYEDYNNNKCIFQIRFEGERLLTDLTLGGYGCMSGCGARGSLRDTEFSLETLNKSPHESLTDFEVCYKATNGWMKGFANGMTGDIYIEFENRNLSLDKCSLFELLD